MMLTLHFYRVYPVINSSMGDRRGKERPRSSGFLEFLRWRNNWRFTSLQISLSFSGKIRLVARAALLWQKYRRINSSSRQDANDSSTDGGGGGRRGGAYTRVHAAPGCIEALVRKRRSHSQHLLAQIVEDIFLASGKFFSPISPSLALSLILSFTKGTEFLVCIRWPLQPFYYTYTFTQWNGSLLGLVCPRKVPQRKNRDRNGKC